MGFIVQGNPNIIYVFNEDVLLMICQEAKELHLIKPYNPAHKCIVFNPYKNLNSSFKQIIHKREIGKFNTKIVLKESKNRTIEQIARKTNLAKVTVRNHLSKNGIKKK